MFRGAGELGKKREFQTVVHILNGVIMPDKGTMRVNISSSF